ncbi:MAG TPA: hypothetical protein VJL83_05905 [Patescibacteria group bacterium]|nr:hypothetical protein [Patescibacteria group bacterium]
MAKSNYNNVLTQLERTLDEYFGKKAPALPANVKDIIVKIAPYLVIISVIFMLPGLLALFGLGGMMTAFAPFGGMGSAGMVRGMWVSILLFVPVIILEVMAIPGLFSRTITAWRYVYWGQLIAIVASLVQFDIFGAIISALIGFYILFQIKSFYK